MELHPRHRDELFVPVHRKASDGGSWSIHATSQMLTGSPFLVNLVLLLNTKISYLILNCLRLSVISLVRSLLVQEIVICQLRTSTDLTPEREGVSKVKTLRELLLFFLHFGTFFQFFLSIRYLKLPQYPIYVKF